MNAPRDPARMVRAFLMEGQTELADQVYDAVRATVEHKRQRVVLGPWRLPEMNKFVTIGLGAAAVVVALFLGAQFFGSPTGGVGSQPTATLLPTPTPEPTPSLPASPPPLTQTFTSALHGYSVSYPEGWTAEAATEPWTASTFPLSFTVPQVDWLYDPDLEASLFLAIASQPIGDSTSEDWLAEQMGSEEGCDTTASQSITVDGGTGLSATDCTMAVVTADGRGYWIQLYTGDEAPVSYDRAWFEEVLATVQLHPEDAVD
jgi:hypothetical protein